MGRGFALAAGLGALALLASCAEEDEANTTSTATMASSSATPSPTSASPTPTSTPALDQYGCEVGPDGEKCRLRATHTPVPDPTPGPPPASYPPGTRTGVPEVDAVIAAIERKDAARLAQLVNFLSYPCEEDRPQQPQPVRCGEGQQPGGLVYGIWAVEVEGGLLPPSRDGDREALVPHLEQMLFRDRALTLHSVFKLDGTESESSYLRPDYVVTFAWWHSQAGPRFDSFLVRDRRLIAMEFSNPVLLPSRWDNPDDPGWLLPRAQ